ncbi:MAG: hypothetical protein GXP29_09580 [Planctomycetes bacterium]|nr:hypothetical protein [Planctomycetota bacterium]
MKLLEDTGGEATEADLLVALGAAFSLCSYESANGEFPILAECHDLALPEAADLFGIRLRALHPPRARFGLDHSAEFAEHFEDSYVPLIERAVAHGQPVLALRGWPAESGATWGLILPDECGNDPLRGVAGGSRDVIPLVEPALQCYVIEEVHPEQPQADDVLLCGARAAVRLVEEGPRVYPGLLLTPQTLAGVAKVLERSPDVEALQVVRNVASVLAARRGAAARYLEQHAEGMRTQFKDNVRTLRQLCEQSAKNAHRLSSVINESGQNRDAARNSLAGLSQQSGEMMSVIETISGFGE